MRDLGAGDDDRSALNAGDGAMEDLVLARDFESREAIVALDDEAIELAFELDSDRLTLDVGAKITRAGGGGAEAIDAAEGGPGEPLAEDFAIHPVDFGGVAEIDGGGHRGVGEGEGGHLGFAELGPIAGHGLGGSDAVVGELDEDEWERAARLFAPGGDHHREESAVIVGAAHVRLSLIPEDALEAEVHQGMDHGVVEDGGGALGLVLLAGLVAGADGDGIGRTDESAEIRMIEEGLVGGPGLGGGPSPVAFDEADPVAEATLEVAGELDGELGEVVGGDGIADFPMALDLIEGDDRDRLLDLEEAEAGSVEVARRSMLARGLRVVIGPLHVRLAGTDPNFAHENVVEGEAVGDAFDFEGAGRSGGGEVHLDAPSALGVGHGPGVMAADLDVDDLAGGGVAVDRSVRPGLEDHVVAEEGGHADGGRCDAHEGREHRRAKGSPNHENHSVQFAGLGTTSDARFIMKSETDRKGLGLE